jgi:tRNA (mo5U34)-methyltransferase
VVDLTPTTVQEQRSTPWMDFESLPDYLDPANPGCTVEGYPAPLRATLVATA